MLNESLLVAPVAGATSKSSTTLTISLISARLAADNLCTYLPWHQHELSNACCHLPVVLFLFIFRGRFKQRNTGGVNAPLTHTVPTRLHTVYYTSVDCNPLSTSVCSKFVIQLVPSVVQQLTRFRMRQHAWRGPSAVAELLVYTAYNMAKDADVMFRPMSSLYCIVCCCLVLLHACYVCITLSHVYIYVVIPELNYSGQPFTMSSA